MRIFGNIAECYAVPLLGRTTACLGGHRAIGYVIVKNEGRYYTCKHHKDAIFYDQKLHPIKQLKMKKVNMGL